MADFVRWHSPRDWVEDTSDPHGVCSIAACFNSVFVRNEYSSHDGKTTRFMFVCLCVCLFVEVYIFIE